MRARFAYTCAGFPCRGPGAADGMRDVIIIGAGIAGLTLARQLQRRGLRPLVVERSRGIGGRCATRRIDGVPVDHGVAFLHGRTDPLCAELAGVAAATALPDWPIVREGDGSPCRPEAFSEHAWRLAFAEGVNRFPRHLAAGVDILLESTVVGLGASNSAREGWAVALASGETLHARGLALTIPAPSAVELLSRTTPLPGEIERILPLLSLVHMVPCLTVLARYGEHAPKPAWDVSLPRTSRAIHTVIHDSRKRAAGSPLTLVIQARPAFSRDHLRDAPDAWSATLLAEAASLHGSWVNAPTVMQAHRWSYARVAAGSELSHPVAVKTDRGLPLGIAGDGFHPAGGVEGAYLSGLTLAQHLADWL